VFVRGTPAARTRWVCICKWVIHIHAAAAETAALEPRWVNSFHAYLAAHSLGKPEWIITKRVSGPCFCSAACFVCRPSLLCINAANAASAHRCNLSVISLQYVRRDFFEQTLVIWCNILCCNFYAIIYWTVTDLWNNKIMLECVWYVSITVSVTWLINGLWSILIFSLLQQWKFSNYFGYLLLSSKSVFFHTILQCTVKIFCRVQHLGDLLTSWGQGGTRLRIDTLLDVLRPIQACQF